MLKREDLIALGFTEEEIADSKMANLLAETQKRGDSIKQKYQNNPEVEQLKKQLEELQKVEKPTENIKTEVDPNVSALQKQVDELKNLINQQTEDKNSKMVANFEREAKSKGFSEEQIAFFKANTKVEALSNFNYDLFPKNELKDTEQKSEEIQNKTLEDELAKLDQEILKNRR